ncbi:MAG TPA: DUF6461 domain-containing protein [Streptosporangiaceae bacterium]|jgi:hypothetical protein
MAATAADYAWFEDRPAGLAESYCLTMARGLTADEFLARIGARSEQTRNGVEALFEPSMDLWREHDGDQLLIGVTTVPGDDGGWALGMEFNGYLGVTEELIVPLSAGTKLVAHSRNIEALSHFYWIEDRDIRLSFEPLFASDREGSTPDALTDVMQRVGFDVGEDGTNEHPTEASFALAEHLTSVRITPDLLERATYTCGIVAAPM